MFLENAYCGAPISFDSFSRSFSLIANRQFIGSIPIGAEGKLKGRATRNSATQASALCRGCVPLCEVAGSLPGNGAPHNYPGSARSLPHTNPTDSDHSAEFGGMRFRPLQTIR
jgi:hypothetical protein